MATKTNINDKRLAKYGLEICKRAWELNTIQGEGATVIAIETGLHINSVAAAIEAYAEHRVSVWKEQSTDYTSWHIEINGEEFCEIKQQCEQWARGGIRARGTKVEGYWVEFADGVMTQWFDASEFRSARAALKAAMAFARSEAAKGGRA